MTTRNGSHKIAVRFDPKELRAAITECEAEARRLEDERQRVLLLAATYRQLIQLHEGEHAATEPTKQAAAKEARPRAEASEAPVLATRFSGKTIADAAFAVLAAERGRPMHAIDILTAMREGGRPVTSGQPGSSLQGTLSKDPRFEHTGEPNTWRLAKNVAAH